MSQNAVLINNEFRAASAAAGGTALSTTLTTIALPIGTEFVSLEARNFVTGVVAQYALCPYLTILRTQDRLATAPTDVSDNAQDGDAATDVTLSSQSTWANGDALYVGSHVPFRGVRVDVDAANGNASVLTVNYWNGSAWVDITATDNTASGGATLAVDGTITWTVPTAWSANSLRNIAALAGDDSDLANTVTFQGAERILYWTRWEVSAALDASTTQNEIHALARSTAYAELTTGKPGHEFFARRGPGGIGAIEALMNAGTGNLIVNAGSGRGFFG